MPIELAQTIDVASTILLVGILVLGIYRAMEMRRAFVVGVYRSRATWSTLLMLVIIVVLLSSFVPFPSSGVLSLVGSVPFPSLILVFVAYADKSVLAAMETDFFHRDTLGWTRGRWPVAIVLVTFVVILGVGGAILTPAEQASPLWAAIINLFFVTLAAILAYLAASLIVGARRSADRTLRRSIALLGLALFTLVLSIVVTSLLTTGTVPYALANQGTGVAGIYLIYRSVTSLSPLGRIEKEVAATSA